MKIHQRFILAVIALVVGFSACLYVLWYSAERVVASLLDVEMQELSSHFEQVVELERQPIVKGLWNDTFWDDMVAFVKKPNRAWAKENIDEVVPSFGNQFAWAYTPKLALVYTMPSETADPNEVRLPEAALRQALAGSWFSHFYRATGAGIAEYFTAPIQPTADDARRTDPQGYFVTARLVDEAYLQRLDRITGDTVTVEPSSGYSGPRVRADAATGTVEIVEPLLDETGATVAVLRARHNTESVEWAWMRLRSFRGVFAAYAAATLILLGVFCGVMAILSVIWVKIPLGRVAESLDSEDPEPVARYEHASHEFGTLARLLRNFFAQRDALVAEVELRKEYARAAEAAGRVKDDFLSVLSHELRTPLGVILGFAELARDETLEPKERREAVDTIEAAGMQLWEMIESTLEIARLNDQGNQPQIESVSLADIVNEVRTVCARLPRTPGVVMHWPEAIPDLALRTDPRLLRGIVRHLVSNALKFTENGWARVEVAREDGGLSIRVSDTGIGIPPDSRERIFQMFEQLDGSRTRRVGGSGLGLYVVRLFAERLGMTVIVDDRPGGGSVFTVHIPAAAILSV